MKAKVLVPACKAFGLTLVIFVALLCLRAVAAAYNIWILGHHHPKWGNEWGNFRFTMSLYWVMLSVQCGILLIGNATSAILLSKAFTRIPIIICIVFAFVNAVLIIFKIDPMKPFFLFWFPGICAFLTVLGSVIEEKLHPTMPSNGTSKSAPSEASEAAQS